MQAPADQSRQMSPEQYENGVSRRRLYFKGSTPEDVVGNYNRLLATFGRWNADSYMTVQKALAKEPGTQCRGDAPKLAARSQKKPFTIDCGGGGDGPGFPTLSREKRNLPLPTKQPFPIYHRQPTYRNIFQCNRPRTRTTEHKSFSTTEEDSKHTKSSTVSVRAELPVDEPVLKKCELMQDQDNNVLRSFRTQKSAYNTSASQISSVKVDRLNDDINALFADRKIEKLLETHVAEEMDHLKTLVGVEQMDELQPDIIKNLLNLKAALLADRHNIGEFKSMFAGTRWRRKFVISNIENSDDENTVDESDNHSSDSSSLCSGDSLGSSIDYKTRHHNPSRIPYIEELHRKNDQLFDKIAAKWEKVVKKNMIETDQALAPQARKLRGDIALRSHDPPYTKLLAYLNKTFPVYRKKFVPHKARMEEKLRRSEAAQLEKERVIQRRQLHNTSESIEPPNKRTVNPNEPPTKYLQSNPRARLYSIMRDVEAKNSDGAAVWNRKTATDEFLNLRPIILSKPAKVVPQAEEKQTNRSDRTD